jgi:glycosyltransferase involved in cell wall biosynthesis
LIPAYNEAQNIGNTVRAARELPVTDVLVVDDGSKDGTAAFAEEAGARVLRLPYNLGKGAAIQAGLRQVTSEVVLLLDADLGHSARYAAPLVLSVLSGRSDMAVAVFSCRQRRGGGLGLAVGLARWGILVLTGRLLRAPLSGQRAIRSDTLRRLLPLPRDFGFEVGLTLRVLQAGLEIEEIPLPLLHRVTGRSPREIWHRSRQFYHIGRVLLTYRKPVRRLEEIGI